MSKSKKIRTVRKTSNKPLKARFVAFEITPEIRERFIADTMEKHGLDRAAAEQRLMDAGIRKLMATRGWDRRKRESAK